MKKIKVLNLYAGIGGNRKLWKDVEVVAVEIEPKIAEIYQKFFPNDNVVVADAHKFLLTYFQEFDFIWSSPPCPSHGQVRFRLGVLNNATKPIYPDMKLYEEIIFLQFHAKCKWVVENVEPYYKPLIKPWICGRHRFWSNFVISNIDEEGKGTTRWGKISDKEKLKGFDLSEIKGVDKKTLLRNCVTPKLGLHILNMAFKDKQMVLKGCV